jgi:multimeric flavodoxin WrbA
VEGVAQAGGQAEEIRLNDLNVGMCQACGNAWGTCLSEHTCQEADDFQALHARVAKADALVLVTPVYWGEPSESAKAFMDRLRRCESDNGVMAGKPIIAVAAAGGGGGGTVTCLMSMEHWSYHIGARVFDLIPVNRWSREYKLVTIREAARTMAQGVRPE